MPPSYCGALLYPECLAGAVLVAGQQHIAALAGHRRDVGERPRVGADQLQHLPCLESSEGDGRLVDGKWAQQTARVEGVIRFGLVGTCCDMWFLSELGEAVGTEHVTEVTGVLGTGVGGDANSNTGCGFGQLVDGVDNGTS